MTEIESTPNSNMLEDEVMVKGSADCMVARTHAIFPAVAPSAALLGDLSPGEEAETSSSCDNLLNKVLSSLKSALLFGDSGMKGS